MPNPFRIGLAGLGTVGIGVVEILQENAQVIAQRIGRPIEIAGVTARDRNRSRKVNISPYPWVSSPEDLLNIPNIDVIVEMIGGAEDPARSLVVKALERRKSVVTANKALIAKYGFELASLAEKNDVGLRFEAAVAGCVPVIKALRESFASNRLTAVYGILNGTCNYILTQMRETGRDFSDVLKEAQQKGYAEADPSFDIDGIDTGHKLAILTAMAFGARPDFSGMDITGIRQLSAIDIDFASQLGYKIKLLGISKNRAGKIMQSVEPCLVPANSPMGMIEDVYNAVFIEGNFIETPLLTGRGAGGGPTASAVVADIMDLAHGNKIPAFGIPASNLRQCETIDRGLIESRYYLRLTVLDVPGVIADIGAILRDNKISVESLMQRGRDPDQPVPVVLITHDACHADMMKAVNLAGKLDYSVESPCLIRIEEL